MRTIALLLALLALVAVPVGCGGGEEAAPTAETVEGELETEAGGEEGDPEAGKSVYASAGCGGCHVYGPANSSGTAGPNLDESDVDYDGAVQQIENGGGGMPAFKDQLSEKEIADVAAFVTEGS